MHSARFYFLGRGFNTTQLAAAFMDSRRFPATCCGVVDLWLLTNELISSLIR